MGSIGFTDEEISTLLQDSDAGNDDDDDDDAQPLAKRSKERRERRKLAKKPSSSSTTRSQTAVARNVKLSTKKTSIDAPSSKPGNPFLAKQPDTKTKRDASEAQQNGEEQNRVSKPQSAAGNVQRPAVAEASGASKDAQSPKPLNPFSKLEGQAHPSTKETDEEKDFKEPVMDLKEIDKQKREMEEKNRKKQLALVKAISAKRAKSMNEAATLNRIQKQLAELDHSLAHGVSIIRDKIEEANRDFDTHRRAFERAEAEYVQSKLRYYKTKELKENLTEHLILVIQQNEARKAQKLEQLMAQLELSEEHAEEEAKRQAELEAKALAEAKAKAVMREEHRKEQERLALQKGADEAAVARERVELVQGSETKATNDEQTTDSPEEEAERAPLIVSETNEETSETGDVDSDREAA